MYSEPECQDKIEREYLTTWEHDDYKVILWCSDKFYPVTDHTMILRDYLYYEFYDKGILIFSGNEFSPSPLHAIDSEESIMSLLSFLTLQLGDTDKEYFDKYTLEQLAWINTDRCENLSFMVYDFENKDNTNE